MPQSSWRRVATSASDSRNVNSLVVVVLLIFSGLITLPSQSAYASSLQHFDIVRVQNAGIVVDGEPEDWFGIAPVGIDSCCDSRAPGADLKSIRTVADQRNVYFMIEVYDPPPRHDYIVELWTEKMEEVHVHSHEPYPIINFAGDGEEGLGKCEVAIDRVVEFRVPLSVLRNPSQIRVKLVWAWDWDTKTDLDSMDVTSFLSVVPEVSEEEAKTMLKRIELLIDWTKQRNIGRSDGLVVQHAMIQRALEAGNFKEAYQLATDAIANPFMIHVDGDGNDWTGIPSIGMESRAPFKAMYAIADTENTYFMIATSGLSPHVDYSIELSTEEMPAFRVHTVMQGDMNIFDDFSGIGLAQVAVGEVVEFRVPLASVTVCILPDTKAGICLVWSQSEIYLRNACTVSGCVDLTQASDLPGSRFAFGIAVEIPQLEEKASTATDAIRDARSSIQKAETEARTYGLETSRMLLLNATRAFQNGDFDLASTLALQAKEIADAVKPQSYNEAKELLATAGALKSRALTSTFTSSEARTLVQQALELYDSAETAFSRNDFSLARDDAKMAAILFEKAFAAEESYERTEEQMFNCLPVAVLLALATVGVFLFWKKIRRVGSV